MNNLRKFVAAAAASAALGVVAFAATPAAAQDAQSHIINDWRNTNPMSQGPYESGRDWGYDNAPGYGYNRGYAPAYGYGYGYGYGYDDPDVASGATTVAICPDGYRLGVSGRLCWPD
jgi:hypothetical protein